MIRICICGHKESQHGSWKSEDRLFPMACLVQDETMFEDMFECPDCFDFRLDNLKTLEQKYNDKSK